MAVFGQDIHVGGATLIFAASHTNHDGGGYEPAGWALPGGGRIVDGDKAQLFCYRMSRIIGSDKPTFPSSRS